MTFSEWIDVFTFKSNIILNDKFKFDLLLSELREQIDKLKKDGKKMLILLDYYFIYIIIKILYISRKGEIEKIKMKRNKSYKIGNKVNCILYNFVEIINKVKIKFVKL